MCPHVFSFPWGDFRRPYRDEPAPRREPRAEDAARSPSQHGRRHACRGSSLGGLVPYVGKPERTDPMLASLKSLTHLNVEVDSSKMRRIEQIDIIWTKQDAIPVWAFEVEEHTSILSALERFSAILIARPELGNTRQLTIITPKARRRKIQQELTSSSYIGHPQYLENKINYMFYDELEAVFNKYRSRPNMSVEEFHRICHLPPAPERYSRKRLL